MREKFMDYRPHQLDAIYNHCLAVSLNCFSSDFTLLQAWDIITQASHVLTIPVLVLAGWQIP